MTLLEQAFACPDRLAWYPDEHVQAQEAKTGGADTIGCHGQLTKVNGDSTS